MKQFFVLMALVALLACSAVRADDTEEASVTAETAPEEAEAIEAPAPAPVVTEEPEPTSWTSVEQCSKINVTLRPLNCWNCCKQFGKAPHATGGRYQETCGCR